MDNTVISGNKSYGGDGIKTSLTATVGVNGKGFIAQDITFRNDAGRENQQAVALRAEADYLTFYSYFICGDATAVFQNCLIVARLPLPKQYNTITAQQRELGNYSTGIVLQNCTLKATQELEKMGWVEFITESLVQPFYLEYGNRGPGAITEGRMKWTFVTNDPEVVSNFTVEMASSVNRVQNDNLENHRENGVAAPGGGVPP
ncbi:PREDICTED: pectinesterase/pectinesterase inhibitor PPE8B-like [Nicotiana attenuata]|uniref:pectinesterase/pectinesterase inhibitor PPE8B-like n=1 Tax=Nicotiana attenuata TaxID=49451 RepID=UPI0009046E06|nr:PREDICTED: pectinesterase/pectinesterase inhibitor PPE8B-like [Nicotiana attenuata]